MRPLAAVVVAPRFNFAAPLGERDEPQLVQALVAIEAQQGLEVGDDQVRRQVRAEGAIELRSLESRARPSSLKKFLKGRAGTVSASMATMATMAMIGGEIENGLSAAVAKELVMLAGQLFKSGIKADDGSYVRHVETFA